MWLPIYLSFFLSIWLPAYPSVCLSVYASVCLSFVRLSVCLSICLSGYLFSICLSVYLSICMFICLSIYIFLSHYRSNILPVCPSVCPFISLSIYLPFYVTLYLYLSIDRSIYLSTYQSIYLSVYLSINRTFYLFIWSFFFLTARLSMQVSLCLSVLQFGYLSVQLSIYPSFYQSGRMQVCEASVQSGSWQVKNAAILQDVLHLRGRQHQKRSNSASFPSKIGVGCRTDGLVPVRFTIFSRPSVKSIALLRKSEARSYEVLHLSRRFNSANLTVWCFTHHFPFRKSAVHARIISRSGNQRIDPLTCLMDMSLLLRVPHDMHLCRPSSNTPRLPSFLRMPQDWHVWLTRGRVRNPLRLRHSEAWTSKSGPNMSCFGHFDLGMCFAPQPRALFEQLNFHKCSDNEVLWHFGF